MRSENLCEAFIFGALAPPTARPSLDNIMTLSSVQSIRSRPRCPTTLSSTHLNPRALHGAEMMSRLVLLAGVVFTSLVTPGESTDNCPCPILEGYQRPPSDDNGDDIWDGAGTWSGGTGIEPICDTLHDKVWNAWTPVASVWELAGPLVRIHFQGARFFRFYP